MTLHRCEVGCRRCARQRRLDRAADIILAALAVALIVGGARLAALLGLVL